MDTGLSAQVCLVTGAAGGIGSATARALWREGACVALADINLAAAQAAAAAIDPTGERAAAFQADAADEASVQALVAAVEQRWGRIDVLVNNAGVFQAKPLQELTAAEWDRVLGINLRSTLLCAQAVLPGMKARHHGKIVNVGSMAGEVGGVRAGAHYAASKAGVICLTKSLAKTVAGWGINVNTVNPGQIDTDMTRVWPADWIRDFTAQIPLGHFGTADDVANTIVFLSSTAAAFIHGAQVDVNGGAYMP